MLIKRRIFGNFVQSVRFCSTSQKREFLLIQKTTYKTDEWTNINKRFEPFVGTNLYQKKNHPLRTTQEEVVAFFKNWFNEHVDSNSELPVYKNLDPIEANTSPEKLPHAFYVSEDLMLRTHATNREIKLLKSDASNFLMIVDLYRRCQMDAKHFPVFHRLNVVRTINCKERNVSTLKEEQQTALIEMAKHFLGAGVQYRWTDANLKSTDPSWMFEIHHQNEWHRISGGGIIRNEIFEHAERFNTAGWEISIGLERLAMILYNIFDVRLLWNSDHSFLKQFEPKSISEKLQTKLDNKLQQSDETDKNAVVNHIQRPTIAKENTFKSKSNKHEMYISYVLPKDTDFESFPTDDLCKFIHQNTDNAAQQVEVYETFFHPKIESYVLNVRVVYKSSASRTKKDINNLHASARAHAAHNFNLELRL